MQFSELKDKVCLVSGASRGIGAAVARGLGRCGARVAVHYRSGRSDCQRIGPPRSVVRFKFPHRFPCPGPLSP